MSRNLYAGLIRNWESLPEYVHVLWNFVDGTHGLVIFELYDTMDALKYDVSIKNIAMLSEISGYEIITGDRVVDTIVSGPDPVTYTDFFNEAAIQDFNVPVVGYDYRVNIMEIDAHVRLRK